MASYSSLHVNCYMFCDCLYVQLIAEGRRYIKEMEQAEQRLQRAKTNYNR